MNIHFAPLQGHTTAPYRYYHSKLYRPASAYYTPFIRLENNDIKKRDQRELSSELNDGLNVVPQIIFRDYQELSSLVGILKEKGVKDIDLNVGCPFPLQTGKGRGAAMVGNPIAPEIIKKIVSENPKITFSVKMRLGLDNNEDWKNLLPTLNSLPIKHIALHPRIGKQQYNGEPDLKSFEEFYAQCEKPLIYNGDLKTLEQFNEMMVRFPRLEGLMAGRGLLVRPSLTDEIADGEEWDRTRRIEYLLKFHRSLLDHYNSTLCGESQILDNIKPFWEYAEDEIGRKPWKNIRKASNMAKYLSAVALID